MTDISSRSGPRPDARRSSPLPPPEPAIEVKRLEKRYGARTALGGLDLTVRRGSLFALLGPNGAGKSTTIQILTTLLAPSSGVARVAGYDVQRDAREVRRACGVVFQETSLDDRLTARENLHLHAAIFGVPPPLREERVEARLAWVGLDGAADQIVRTLSGGMKRRLEIARALVHDPSIVILDEPTVGLDPQTRRTVWDHLAHLTTAEPGDARTVFVTTHYMDEAERCDDVAILDHGRLVARGSPAELIALGGGTRLEDAFVALTGRDIRDDVDEGAGNHAAMRTRLRARGRG